MINPKAQSNIAILSNLQLVNKNNIKEDRQFLEAIRDPRALEKLWTDVIQQHYGYDFTYLQELIYQKTAEHCFYADEGDYPIGIIKNAQGYAVSVCKCVKATCPNFKKCRPDLSGQELQNIKDEYRYIHIKEGTLLEKSANKVADISDEIEDSTDVPNQKSTENTVPFLEENNKDIGVVENVENQVVINSEQNDEESWEYNSDDMQCEKNNALQNTQSEIGAENLDENSNAFEPSSQDDFIHMPLSSNIVVNAGPGTGKTYALIKRLMYLIKTGELDADTILILCFTNAAADVIRTRLKKVALENNMHKEYEEIEIRTFDSFATNILYMVHSNDATYTLSGKNYEERIQLLNDELTSNPAIMENCNYFVVDEIQDLVGVRAEMVLNILSSLPSTGYFCLLGDKCQAIYDYSVSDENDMLDSHTFYKEILKAYPEAKYIEFFENHRFSEKRVRLLQPLRQALMNDNSQAVVDSLSAISNQYQNKILKESSMNFNQTTIDKLRGGGSIAFLTRQNAEALRLSTTFHNCQIEHSILLPSEKPCYAGWIGRFFSGYPDKTVDKDRFLNHFLECMNQKESGEMYWQALIETQEKKDEPFYVSDLLHGILQRGRNKLFFLDTKKESGSITISTIHRAKGKEYDVVCLPESVLNIKKDTAEEEGRISYVALTRSKKTTYLIQPRNRRRLFKKRQCNRIIAYASSVKHRRSKMGYIEFGLDGDINPYCFANQEIQDAIHDGEIVPGFGLELEKDEDLKDKKYPMYRLWDADGELDFGIIPNQFMKDYSFLYQKCMDNSLGINRSKASVLENSDYPDVFNDLYVTAITSYISTTIPEKSSGVAVFDDICIWNSLSISGLLGIQLGIH